MEGRKITKILNLGFFFIDYFVQTKHHHNMCVFDFFKNCVFPLVHRINDSHKKTRVKETAEESVEEAMSLNIFL